MTLRFRISFAVGTLLGLSMMPVLSAQEHDAPHQWAYSGDNGPEHWSLLDPAFAACAHGRAESPIDLARAETASLPPLTFDYHPGDWQIVNNGYTVEIIVPPGSSLNVAWQKYDLMQFHFHHPSEEAIAGKHFDMVIHLVHKDVAGHLAVVAILLSDGGFNPTIQTLWENIPHEKRKLQRMQLKLNPMLLLPIDRGYYAFQGSLTTPPCTEGVRWFVLKLPSAISKGEEQTFAKLYPNNARPLQPLNGRTVEVSK